MYITGGPATADLGVESKVLLEFCGVGFWQKLLLQTSVDASVVKVVADIVQLISIRRVAKIEQAEVVSLREVYKIRDLAVVVVR